MLFTTQDKYNSNLTITVKSIDGVLGIQTWGGRMEGTDESTELWRHPAADFIFNDEVYFSQRCINFVVVSIGR